MLWRTFMVVGLLVGLLVGSGCASRGSYWSAEELASVYDRAGVQRSVAFAPPLQRELAYAAGLPAVDAYAWYADRKDAQLAVEHGFDTPTAEHSRSVTVDRQRVIRGRVRDHSFERTYRERHRETVR